MRLLRKSILALPHCPLGAMGEPHALRSLRPDRRQMDRQEVHQPDETGALTNLPHAVRSVSSRDGGVPATK